MKKIIIFICALSFFGSTHANELQLIQRVEVTISAPESKDQNYSKTFIFGKPTQFDVAPYRFKINSEQIKQKNQALIKSEVSKIDDKGEYQTLYNPTLMVNFKKQAQFKTEDGEVTIDFRTIVERQKVSNQ